MLNTPIDSGRLLPARHHKFLFAQAVNTYTLLNSSWFYIVGWKRQYCVVLENVLDEIAKALQKDDVNMADVRALFDTVIEKYPKFSDRLCSTATIIQQKDFETCTVKILENNWTSMSVSELEATHVRRPPGIDLRGASLLYHEKIRCSSVIFRSCWG